jgi:hypothetical protein
VHAIAGHGLPPAAFMGRFRSLQNFQVWHERE